MEALQYQVLRTHVNSANSCNACSCICILQYVVEIQLTVTSSPRAADRLADQVPTLCTCYSLT